LVYPFVENHPKNAKPFGFGWNNKLLVENEKSWTKVWHENGASIEEKDHMFMNAMQ
jgi:hypothetical protein